MPDEHKFVALQAAGFRVVPTCETCVNYTRSGPVSSHWGHCSAISYEHVKHSPPSDGSARETGVPRNGWCPKYELDEEELTGHTGTYARFFQPDSHAE